MAKNKIDDLRDHLFAQLERLGDESLKGEELEAELQRAKMVATVAREITASAKVEVDYIEATGQKPQSLKFFDRPALPGSAQTLEHARGGK